MYSLQNIPQYDRWDGQPWRMTERSCPNDCPQAAALGCDDHTTWVPYSLAQFIRYLIGCFPDNVRTMTDIIHAVSVAAALKSSEKTGLGIDLDADDYKWLEDLLFSDRRGIELGLKGALVANRLHPILAGQLYETFQLGTQDHGKN